MAPFYFRPLWTLIFWLSYMSWAGFEMWVWSRDRHAPQGQMRDRGSLFSVLFGISFAIGTIFMAPWFAPFARLPFPAAPVFFTGISLIWFGLAFRLWAIQTLGKFFRYTVFVHQEHRLVTSGPYAVLRHPSYTGALMTVTGMALAMHNWFSHIGGVGLALTAYVWRIQVEEDALECRFGDAFRRQRAQTWAVLPFIW